MLNQSEVRARRELNGTDYERFRPIVTRIAMRFARKLPSTIAVADLVGWGWLGLMEAYQRGSTDMTAEAFEAYALYRIRGAMLDHLRSLDSVKRATRRHSKNVTRTIRKLQNELGRAPTDNEIAAEMSLSLEQYRDLLSQIAQADLSRLEMLDIDQLELEDRGLSVEDTAARQELCGAVASAITQLPQRLQQLLALYYQHGCKFREISEILQVSESRVSQLHTEAIHHLRAFIGAE